MVEFGAKLSLKDNMSATLQKNLKTQQKFSSQVKKTSNNMKTLNKTKANPTISAKDKATAILNKVKSGLKAVANTTAKVAVAIKDQATAGLNKIKDLAKSLAKGFTIAVGIAGAGASLLVGGSLNEGASLQQSTGGVETLFKDDAGVVKKNADMAYKTAGLSANAYMETVTSFSASLLNSLGGDTAQSAKVADMAIIDMADNANKFGTDMESIQNAYQGFAKQNYTMLDNLKLGYGGTAEEMKRLLSDAKKLTGVEYDIDNLADVYSAIHAVQENLDVTGTTAKEASSTFSGSLASMKASWSNLLGNMSTGGDVKSSMEQLIDSVSTFVFDNAIPMIAQIFSSLPTAIKTAIEKAGPKVREAVINLFPASMRDTVGSVFDGIGDTIRNVVATFTPIVSELGAMFGRVASVITNTLGTALGNSGNFLSSFASVISSSIPAVEGILTGIAQAVGYVMPVISSLGQVFMNIFPSILNIVSKVVATLVPIIQRIAGIFQAVIAVIEPILKVIISIFSVAWDIISPILDVAMSVIEILWAVIEPIFNALASLFEWVWGIIEPIFNGIADALGVVADAIGGVADFIGGGLDAIGNFFGFAYGKDRVPYDNYPAVLHQGEKVLTRNQADQYDRAMSTRGVQITKAVEEVPRDSESIAKAVEVDAPTPSSNGGGSTVFNIEKLADTVVIEKEADVDKVVEDMVTKFKKLVPNMA